MKSLQSKIFNLNFLIFNFRRNLEIPYDPKFSDINNFLKSMLEKRINQRVNNFTLLANHPIFTDFDIEKLMTFNIKSPFKNESNIDTVDSRRISYMNNINIPLEEHLEVREFF